MDPEVEQQEFLREQDQQFWDTKRRTDQQRRHPRTRSEAVDPPVVEPMRESEAPLGVDAQREAQAQQEMLSKDAPHAPRKAGKPVLPVALVLLLLLGAGAAFAMWSNGALPFAKIKSETAAGVAGPAVQAALPPLAQAEPPALPAATAPVAPITPVVPSPPATDPKLAEQLARLEKRLDQLVAGFKAQGYIKAEAGADGADIQTTDFLPHPSTVPAPVPVRVSAPAATRPAVARAGRKTLALPVPLAPKPSYQVLSVDMWDGRPSVVVGAPGANSGPVRVLQPGDSYNGVTLTDVDVSGQRATFSDGGRSVSIAVERQP